MLTDVTNIGENVRLVLLLILLRFTHLYNFLVRLFFNYFTVKQLIDFQVMNTVSLVYWSMS